ncbi:MAG: element excision factor XisH family protein [Snowella sp.]
MPARDSSHEAIKQAVINDGWVITDDPYVISYGDRFLFVDLGANRFIGIRRGDRQLANGFAKYIIIGCFRNR